MTVEEIVSKWNEQLEEDASKFKNQAEKISQWDQRLRCNQKDIATLADQVQRLLQTQEDLDSSLSAVKSNQNELDTSLAQLEGEVKELYERHRAQQLDDADLERERTHRTAQALNEELDAMLGSLNEVVTSLNDSFLRHAEDKSTMTTVVQILNTHQHMLHWLESNSQKLDQDLASVGQQLKRVSIG